MKDIREISKEICNEINYDEILLEILKSRKESSINTLLEEISFSKNLKQEEKNRMYNKIFEYEKECNERAKEKIKEILLFGVNKGIIEILKLSEEEIKMIKNNN